ncbi:helix-turn-helix transcriptional regulator [Caulobacter sp. 17J65-9]|uniref:helix-turn-helix domain-containing protein n=1 Tax=Caulobacter sp. 17J65-9 TaxID=2709382 RepID=UPI0013CAA750|nr:helix-turn-helix transcriptional regulator [Caulobacter sp. 17J65-9]NEX91234.1 helix-turn-helix transcriptional regulator [Caulobacter sp. 17J65-9]
MIEAIARPAPNRFDIVVGARVSQVRKAKGMSQGQLAQALRLTLQQMQSYERGADRISCSRLTEIGAALDAPMRELLGETISKEAARAWNDRSMPRTIRWAS